MQEKENHSKITVSNVSTWYGAQAVLKDINMKIRERAVTGFIGPSGCGKSTFLRCLNRLNDLVNYFRIEGEITLHGENIYSPDTDVVLMRRKIGMVFQQPNPFPMSIFDNVAFGPREHNRRINKKELEDIVEESLKKANLWNEVYLKLNDSALNLSGGQQQRLCIARVLAVMPEIILFDEPCSSLDPASTAKIEELMTELKNSYSVVVVTHNLGQAKRISDYIGFFLNGRLVEYGPAPEIINSPREKVTSDYLEGNFG
ncbi:phosphate transport ATP-binding protein PstB [Desulfocucumis palustris]|uniref:Phosphate transport ATP-binding protein PstB n=1 Tax=Desulfocucumis palustris TaxID=1898651 RepID=A0A2L2X939_9FIRM|nr:phosphate ABC transporter ATP-binding protein PstB [Desulfocucumis palustris]GBF32638.1 phosphate transport ATP-binding protein PstB [Desulfocucumis palustris]